MPPPTTEGGKEVQIHTDSAHSLIVWDDQIELLEGLIDHPGALGMLARWKVPKPIPGLDAGIAPWVQLMRQHSVETYQSCEGGEGHSFPEPTIQFHGGPGAGFHAYSVARIYALPITEVRRVWSETDGELTGPTWEIVFREKAQAEKCEHCARIPDPPPSGLELDSMP